MKKLLFPLVLLLCIAIKAGAQTAPPADSKTTLKKGRKLIANYQKQASHHPSAFLMKTSGLRDMLKAMNPANCYLHIYMAAMDNDCTNEFLAFVPTVYDNKNIYHDNALPNPEQVYCTAMKDPDCCTVADSLDGPDSYSPPGCTLACPVVIYDKPDLKPFIANYERKYVYSPAGPMHTQSYLLNATRLRKLLLETTNQPVYIEIYIGASDSITSADHTTIIIVGVDKNGNHIYFTESSYPGIRCVFDECRPCPVCNIEFDPELDYQNQ